ncbi:hypothetical protein [Mesorhizobium sp.]|uniref:hypothetical protein n=1 Tax=Mesorhizobium sp. TaxID=1871066 RepID=UPI000FE52983|nr:hypothetical protein [Mesorhizobium sp.]RWE23503.1 MAG: hypothetical protein EOS77_30385 [Mesorhizobium sp.]
MPFSGEVFTPEEVALLGRVFDRTGVPAESRTDREQRALNIIFHYRAGVTDEAELEQLANKDSLARQPAAMESPPD